MEDEILHRLSLARTVREFVGVLGVELYAMNADEVDLSLDMLKTLNTDELINIGFSRGDAFKLTTAIFSLQKLNGMPRKTKKAVHFADEPPQRLVYEDISRGPPLVDRLKKLARPDMSMLYLSRPVTILTAASLNNFHVLRQIIRKNALEMMRKNRFGWTPILMAAQKGNLEVVQVITSYHYNTDCVSCRDHMGRTPLMLAANWGHANVVEHILQFLQELERQKNGTLAEHFQNMDNDGQTALHLAVIANQVKCVMCLRQYGINPMIHNRDGVSALETARRWDRKEACDILNPRKDAFGRPAEVRLGNSA